MRFTVLGNRGYIGSHLVAKLRTDGYEVLTPDRDDTSLFSIDLGHVFYCIGLTADFRSRPFDTVRSHACVLADILERARFDSFLYLSSTRVYGKSVTAQEISPLIVDTADPSDLYNLSKLMGESLCLCGGRDNVRAARVSNVYGSDFTSDNFLSYIVRQAVDTGSVTLKTSADSEKDYVNIDYVVNALISLALAGRHHLYNVASGVNISNNTILTYLEELTGCSIIVAPDSHTIRFPVIDVSRLREVFSPQSPSLLHDLPSLIQQYREYKT